MTVDPTENLRQQLALASSIARDAENTDEADSLAYLVLALNEWITKGGFLPIGWQMNAEARLLDQIASNIEANTAYGRMIKSPDDCRALAKELRELV
jgi:hypothetical protein